MSVQAITWVMENAVSTGGTRLVLICIANYHGEFGAWPSIDRLAQDARCSPRTIQRCIRDAEKRGDLTVYPGKGKHGTNRYVLHMGDWQNVTPPIWGTDKPRHEMSPEPKELGSIELTTQTPGVLDIAPRKRDALFEVVAEVCGVDWQNGITKTGRGSLNSAVAQLRPLNPSPEEVRLRAANWPYDVPLTPPGLAKHWSTLLSYRQPRKSAALKLADELERQGR